MKNIIAFLLTSVVFVIMMLTEVDNDIAVLLNNRSKTMINRAVHDASLYLDPIALSEGQLYYDQPTALLALDESLRRNSNSLLGNYRVEMVDFIDDKDNVSYPFLYTNNTYRIFKTINGPAVVAVIKIEKPAFYLFSYPVIYKKWAVYEYPLPK